MKRFSYLSKQFIGSLLLIFLFYSPKVSSQVKMTTSQRYIISIDHFGVNHGLVHRAASAILKDSRGIVWVGTRFGLSRFDGYIFKNFELPETWELPISSIIEDKDGYLWLSNLNCKNLILFHAKHKVWKKVSELNYPKELKETNKLITVSKTKQGNLVFIIQGLKKVFLYKGSNQWQMISSPVIISKHYNNFGSYFSDEKDTLYRVDNGKIIKDVDLHNWHVKGHSVIKTPLGALFYKGNMKELNYCSPKNKKLYLKDKNAKYIYGNDILFDFLLDIEGLGIEDLYTTDIQKIYDLIDHLIPQLRHNAIHDFIHEDGKFFLINNFGLFVVNIRKALFNNYAKSFGVQDESGKLFSVRGLCLKGNSLLAMQEESGLYSINLASRKVEKIYPKNSVSVGSFSLLNLKNKNYLVQMDNKQILLDSQFNVIQKFYKSNASAFASFEVSPNLVLLGPSNYSQTIQYLNLNNGNYTPFNSGKFNHVKNCVVNYMSLNREGDLVICSRNGVFICNKNYEIIEEWNNIAPGTIRIPSGAINYFYHDRDDGTYWLATGNKGLIHVNRENKTYTMYNIKKGFPDNTINAIADDGNGCLWLSCDNGIVCLNKKTKLTLHYTENDGLSFDEFNRASFVQGEDGTLYFGSLDGVSSFLPGKIIKSKSESNLKVNVLGFLKLKDGEKDLSDYSKDYFFNSMASINNSDKYCVFDISILNYDDNRNVTYAYRIKNLDEHWSFQKSTSIKLWHIPYGKHTLLVKGLIPGHGWTEEIEVNLNVLTPFYLKTWFIFGCVLLTGLMIFLYLRWKTDKLTRDREHLVQEVQLKTKTIQDQSDALQNSLDQKEVLLKEIHHRVKNNLQVINSLLEMQNNRLEEGEAKIALKEGQIRIMSIALIHEQLFQNENLSFISLKDFVNNLYGQIYMVFNETKRPVTFELSGDDLNVEIETAVPLGLLLNELITNSFKHAFFDDRDNFLHMVFKGDENCFSVIYHDSGPGISKYFDIYKTKSLGMRLIQSLSKQINGEVIYHNDKNEYRIRFSQNLVENEP